MEMIKYNNLSTVKINWPIYKMPIHPPQLGEISMVVIASSKMLLTNQYYHRTKNLSKLQLRVPKIQVVLLKVILFYNCNNRSTSSSSNSNSSNSNLKSISLNRLKRIKKMSLIKMKMKFCTTLKCHLIRIIKIFTQNLEVKLPM